MLKHGTSTFILGSDSATDLERVAGQVAPPVREFVEVERNGN